MKLSWEWQRWWSESPEQHGSSPSISTGNASTWSRTALLMSSLVGGGYLASCRLHKRLKRLTFSLIQQTTQKWPKVWKSSTVTLMLWSSTPESCWRKRALMPYLVRVWLRWALPSPWKAWWVIPSVLRSTGSQAPSEETLVST